MLSCSLTRSPFPSGSSGPSFAALIRRSLVALTTNVVWLCSYSYNCSIVLPQYRYDAFGVAGQKVSVNILNKTASAGQRLVLALASLLFMMIMFVIDVLVASSLPWDSDRGVAVFAVFVLLVLYVIFAVVTVAINMVFNRNK
jgi:hypothetical protein